MKIRFLKFAGTIFLLFLTKATFAAEAESFTVNGLKVIFKQNTATDIIAANMYFKGGAAMLNEKLAGIENFALNVAQKATENYPKDELNAALEKMNSQISSSASLDYSSLKLLCVKQNFPKSWDLFADVVLHPLFADEDVELERQKIVSSIEQKVDNPDAYLNDLFMRAFYIDHPYSLDVDGTVANINAFSVADLKSYYRDHLETSRMLLVVVGNTSRAELEKMVGNAFGSLATGEFLMSPLPEIDHQTSSLKIVERELPTNYIQGGFTAPAYGSEESYPMMIATSILRDRLFEEVRTKRSLSYAPAAGYASARSGYGYIYVTAVDPDTTVKVMMHELDRLKNEKISEKDLDDKVNVFITRYYLSNETNQSQAELLARYEMLGGGFAQSQQFIDNLKKVTPEDVQKVSEKFFKNLQFVLLGNPSSLQIKNFML